MSSEQSKKEVPSSTSNSNEENELHLDFTNQLMNSMFPPSLGNSFSIPRDLNPQAPQGGTTLGTNDNRPPPNSSNSSSTGFAAATIAMNHSASLSNSNTNSLSGGGIASNGISGVSFQSSLGVPQQQYQPPLLSIPNEMQPNNNASAQTLLETQQWQLQQMNNTMQQMQQQQQQQQQQLYNAQTMSNFNSLSQLQPMLNGNDFNPMIFMNMPLMSMHSHIGNTNDIMSMRSSVGLGQLPLPSTNSQSDQSSSYNPQIQPAQDNGASVARVSNTEVSASLKSDVDSTKNAKESSSTEPVKGGRETRWTARYNELVAFQRQHGHCRVPHGYGFNRKLAWWVMNQRAQFSHMKQGKKTWLTRERIQMLDDLGFIWNHHLTKISPREKQIQKSQSKGEGGEARKSEASVEYLEKPPADEKK